LRTPQLEFFLMPFFLGIDGGGTKTRCVIGDEKSELSVATSSSSKVQRVGEACARDALAGAVHEACVHAGISPRQIVRSCAGITGAARPEIVGVMRDLMTSIVDGQVEIVGDIEIAFEDGFGSGPGLMLIAGTGSIAFGRNKKGESARAAGWGYPISDEGSGQWIGAEAVREALHARDRCQPAGLLNDLIEKLGSTECESAGRFCDAVSDCSRRFRPRGFSRLRDSDARRPRTIDYRWDRDRAPVP
jgi:glucosamine kinase